MHFKCIVVELNLKAQNCLVIGAGEIAARKIELLAKSGAIITVIANKVSSTIANLQNTHNLIFKAKLVEKSDLEGFRLVVLATNNSDTDRLVAKTANELDILINVVDNPALCSFIFPAMIDLSPVITAVSSVGTSPILARLLRAKIESTIPPRFWSASPIS